MKIRVSGDGERPETDALHAAVNLLARRAWLSEELRIKLLGKGFEVHQVDNAIQELQRRGFLNDRSTLADLVLRSQDGRLRIEASLRLRSASEEQIAEALSIVDDEAELAKIGTILKKKYPGGADRAKAGRYLVSRGFEENLIETGLDRFLGDG